MTAPSDQIAGFTDYIRANADKWEAGQTIESSPALQEVQRRALSHGLTGPLITSIEGRKATPDEMVNELTNGIGSANNAEWWRLHNSDGSLRENPAPPAPSAPLPRVPAVGPYTGDASVLPHALTGPSGDVSHIALPVAHVSWLHRELLAIEAVPRELVAWVKAHLP